MIWEVPPVLIHMGNQSHTFLPLTRTGELPFTLDPYLPLSSDLDLPWEINLIQPVGAVPVTENRAMPEPIQPGLFQGFWGCG